MIFQFLVQISNQTGIPQDFIRIACAFIFNIILSYLFRYIRNYTIRLLYSLIFGVFFLALMLEDWALYVVATGIVSYFFIKFLKSNQWIVSVLIAFSFLLFIHFYRFFFDYQSWKLDCSVMQMFLTTRIIYFGLYLQNTKPQNRINDGFLQYTSYIFFFPGVLIGPTFAFDIFIKYIKLQDQYKNIKYRASSVYPLILKGLLHSIITIFIVSKFPSDWFITNQFFIDLNFVLKILFSTLIGIVYRIKFYTGWAFTQAAINLSGISYDSSKDDYQAVTIGSQKFQLQINPRLKTQYWNSSVQKWLRICFYQPITKIYGNNSSIPVLIAFFTSGLWHGIYPIYLISFIQWAFVTNIAKFFYKASHKFKMFEGNFLFKILVWTSGQAILHYIAVPVVLLDTGKAFKFLNSIYWYGTFVIFGLYAFFSITRWGQVSKDKGKTQAVKKER